MRMLVAISVTVVLAATVFAQQAAAPDMTKGTYVSAADVAAAIAKMPRNALASAPILRMGKYTVNIEHRLAEPAQQASVHDNDAELFVMLDGTATLVTGGTPTNGTKKGTEWRGASIEGGTSQKMSKGDFMMVPPGVPHWFSHVDGTITEMSIHLPMK